MKDNKDARKEVFFLMHHQWHLFHKKQCSGSKTNWKKLKSEARGERNGRSSLKERTLLNRVARAKHRLFRRRANTAQYTGPYSYIKLHFRARFLKGRLALIQDYNFVLLSVFTFLCIPYSNILCYQFFFSK